MAEPSIAVADLQTRPADLLRIERVAAYVLVAEGRDADLSVTLVDDTKMSELHAQFSGVEGPTDVLAFPLHDDGGPPSPGGRPLLGEVVVSTDTAAREAEARALSFERELLLYVVHGTLHLLGYEDHEPEQREHMHSRQEDLLDQFYDRLTD